MKSFFIAFFCLLCTRTSSSYSDTLTLAVAGCEFNSAVNGESHMAPFYFHMCTHFWQNVEWKSKFKILQRSILALPFQRLLHLYIDWVLPHFAMIRAIHQVALNTFQGTQNVLQHLQSHDNVSLARHLLSRPQSTYFLLTLVFTSR